MTSVNPQTQVFVRVLTLNYFTYHTNQTNIICAAHLYTEMQRKLQKNKLKMN